MEVSVQDTLPSPPPVFDTWTPASQQQIGHWLGHVPGPALTEQPLGLELLAKPGLGLQPNPGKNLASMFLQNRSDIHVHVLIIHTW